MRDAQLACFGASCTRDRAIAVLWGVAVRLVPLFAIDERPT
jgi:hypothetical protein